MTGVKPERQNPLIVLRAAKDKIDYALEILIERAQAVEPDLTAELHEAMTFNYDQCDHGTYKGGPNNGEPYAMCERMAARIIRKRGEAND